MSQAIAVLCDCCGSLIGYGSALEVAQMRERSVNAGGPKGAVYFYEDRKDMCGKCWGRGCEIGKKHLRRAS